MAGSTKGCQIVQTEEKFGIFLCYLLMVNFKPSSTSTVGTPITIPFLHGFLGSFPPLGFVQASDVHALKYRSLRVLIFGCILAPSLIAMIIAFAKSSLARRPASACFANFSLTGNPPLRFPYAWGIKVTGVPEGVYLSFLFLILFSTISIPSAVTL